MEQALVAQPLLAVRVLRLTMGAWMSVSSENRTAKSGCATRSFLQEVLDADTTPVLSIADRITPAGFE